MGGVGVALGHVLQPRYSPPTDVPAVEYAHPRDEGLEKDFEGAEEGREGDVHVGVRVVGPLGGQSREQRGQ